MKFRKKPVVINAIQWDGREETIEKVFDLLGDGKPHATDCPTGVGE